MRKNKPKTLPQLIASKLITHGIATFLLIVVVLFLFFKIDPLSTRSKIDSSAPNPVLMQIELKDYPTLTEQYLIDYSAQIQVINADLTVIDSVGDSQVPIGYQYTIAQFMDLLLVDQPNQLMRSNSYTDDNGQTYTIIMTQQLQQDFLQIIQSTAHLYAISIIVISILIILIMLSFLIRSIYDPLQQNLSIIQQSISKMPQDTSPVDTNHISLVEIKEVMEAYNAMLRETESARLQKQQLEEKSHRLISNLSHDLKSPMTVLKGYSEVLSQGELTPQQQAKYLEHIHMNIASLNSMVDLLFDQVKFQYNDYTLKLEHKDINSFLRDICANYYMVFEQQGFTMDIHIDEAPYYMEFDQVNMRRVFSNLLENVMFHNPTPTQVAICTRAEHDQYCIQIKDNGVGIAEEHREKVFEPLYQGDHARTEKHGGLGLFVVKQILEKHGCTIALTSQPQYKTVFTICKPYQS